MSNKSQWIEMHKNNRFRPKYPEPEIVRWLFKNLESGSLVLDDGCGAGRHIKLLAENGYIPYGIDYSDSGIDYTKSLLSEYGYSQFIENLVVGSCDCLPFENEKFNGVISYGVLYYLENEAIKKAVDEIYRVLKPGGTTVVVVRSHEDYRNASIEDKGYISVSDSKLSANAENGMHEHFFSRQEIVELFSQFKDVSIERIIRTYQNESICDNDFLIIASK